MNPITVLLAEDHAIVREGLRTLLELEQDISVVGEAENGRQAVELAERLRPDVVVMDIAMPLLNGMEATRQILRDQPETRIIILSAHGDEAYVERVISLGACGYLVKQITARILPEAIRKAHRGETCFSPAAGGNLVQNLQGGLDPGGPNPILGAASLTSREMEVLQLVAEGAANKQIAAELHISIKTVEKHRQSLMNKLDIHDTAGLTRFAISAGIIESSVQVTII